MPVHRHALLGLLPGMALPLLLGTMLTEEAFGQLPYPDGGTVRSGSLPAKWATGGPKCAEQPAYQVHEYNPDFFILRENGCVHYEKPFLFVLFGRDRALLLDTGAGESPIDQVVLNLRKQWLQRNKRESIPLVVAHTHEHSDHVAGDAKFKNREAEGITFHPATVEAHQALFGIKTWPTSIGQYDLGGRILDVIPIPGHAKTAVAFYDRQTGVLITADNLYPGRLYVSDLAEFTASNKRMIDFTAGKVVTHLFGCHIEQTNTPYLDYPIGSVYQPDEHEYAMGRAHLLELQEALTSLNGQLKRLALRDFTIWPLLPETLPELKSMRSRTEGEHRAKMWDQEAPVAATSTAAEFVPKSFVVPTEKAGSDYKLVPLGPGLEKLDFDAYMGSMEHIRTTFGGGRWPTPGITMKEALEDVQGEKQRFDARKSFTYAVLTPDGKRERGCVYISPARDPRYQAQVRIWVTKPDLDAGLEGRLWEDVRKWVNTDWPFTKVQFRQQ